jgi:V/A-type H+-transporting ATPase subunit I
MLRPVQMSRVVVAGSKDVMEPVIEKMHELNLLHVVNYSGNNNAFEMGKTIGRGKEFSEKLIKLRSVSRYLDIKSKAPDYRFTESDIQSKLDNLLGSVADDVTTTFERIAAIEAEVKVKGDQINALKPLSVLPIPLDLFYGYESLSVSVGSVATTVDADVAKVSPNSEVFSGSAKNATVIAVFSPVEKAADVANVLAEHGFTEISVPKLQGMPDAAIAGLEADIKRLEGERGPLQKKLLDMKKQYEDQMLAADEFLSMQTQKTDAPLMFATSENTFVVDGWVPTEKFETLKSGLEGAAGGRIHVEKLGESEADKLAEGGEDIPTKMDNPGIVKPYELITRLFAIPEYKEYDPTFLIFLFFPIMFGMILGDIGYGIMTVLALILLKKKFRTPGWQSLINIVLIASVWSIIFGFVFGEVFGPLGLWGRIFGHISEHEIEVLKETGKYFGEGVYLGLGRIGPGGMFPMDRLATNAVLMLIGVSIFIGVVHCSVGSILGIKTELNYGEKKHAYFERLPVLLFQVFFALFLLGLVMGMNMALVVPSAIILVVSIVMMVMGPEGPMGMAHVPFYVSNLISYLRLLAIGLASVGLAFAANQLAFYVIMPMLSGGAESPTIPAAIAGLVILVAVHFINMLLGILSPFMHPLRLHYVEMFTKFYSAHGGGIEYSPFGHVRRYLKV